MPTKRPRLNVTITPELMEALREFRRASGQAPASLIAQMLINAEPVVRAMTDAYRIAQKSPQQAAQGLRDVVTRSQVELAQLQLGMEKPKRRRIRRSTQP